MQWDPYTLIVVLDQGAERSEEAEKATGTLYSDDGESYDFEAGAYIHRRFAMNRSADGAFELRSEDIAVAGKKTKEFKKSIVAITVERVIVVGAPASWKNLKSVDVSEEGAKALEWRNVGFEFHEAAAGKAAWAVVKNPKMAIGDGWKIRFS